jgi:3-deoxy-manno-octulosonate cytidylyltransferase (CMP-KDO synthetase)
VKIVGIIPARFGSTRFPGKPLCLLQGKPLLQWVVEVVQNCKSLDDFYVATDHVEIAELCKKINVKYIMTSTEAATGTDRVFEACQYLEKSGHHYDAVINIQGDEPLLPAEYIHFLVSAFKAEPKLEMVTLSHPLEIDDFENKNAVKVLIDRNKYAIYFSRFAIPFSRESTHSFQPSSNLQSAVQKHIGLYGYSFQFLKRFCNEPQVLIEVCESLEQLRALDMGVKIKVMSVDKPTYGVDTIEDLEKIEKFLNQKVSHHE